ncbi:translation initiation factor IF-2-like [Panthera pardus]|uniref:Translation initiation factor IF-2-like n=1 Tax=Panthera pardus TaxID=9691 RepID=A0A9W2UYZ7_PANPR|nr:translation initiation factor IF-2-like [Panthera pardus]
MAPNTNFKGTRDNLPITESLLFPRIHYHQCPACECVSGEGESGRERRAGGRAGGGRAAAPAPGPGAPSATLSTSPLVAPAFPGHLPPPTPRSLSARAAAPTTRRQRRTGGRGQEDASGSAPRRATASSAFSSSCSAASSPPPPVAAAAWSFSSASCRRRRRRWCRRCRSTNYIRATRTPRPSENLGSFRRAPPLPPSACLPAPRGSGTPPSANLGPPRPSSSSEAWLASSLPGRSFRLPLLFLTRKSGRCRSSLGIVPLGDPLEAVPGGSGMRGEGAAFGRRTVGRERSHRGLNKGVCGCCACAQRRGGGRVPLSELFGRRPPPLRAPAGWSDSPPPPPTPRLGGGRTVTKELPRLATTAAALGEVGSVPLLPLARSREPEPGPGHLPQTGSRARGRPSVGRGCAELARRRAGIPLCP